MTEITLAASDKTKIKASFDAMKIFEVVGNFYQDRKHEEEMPVNISAPILTKIVKLCEEYKNRRLPEIPRPIKTSRMDVLFKNEFLIAYLTCPFKELSELLMAGHYLGNKQFEDLVACAIAVQLFGKKTEEMRTQGGITNDFTPEEDASVKEFFSWADEIWP